MQAGELRNQIVLKRKVATRDSMGGEVVSYVPVVTVAAKAEPVRGRKYENLHIAGSEIDVQFTIYYREDIQPDWRVSWRGVDYDLASPPIDVGARRAMLELMCRTAQT
jgi:SPP1 family predicted phage head-tail adaptor